jgi:nitronate monooxygenase
MTTAPAAPGGVASASPLATTFTRQVGIEVPLICGAMYPCSNPELVAAASDAGGIGIVQPVSLTYVHGHDYREGLRLIRSLTDRPIGMNALIEASSKTYRERMERWIDVALEEGVRFFITSLGNPRWVVDRVRPLGGVVYHDVTERKWAEKGLAGGVHGLIAVNDRAGGHAGPKSAEELADELGELGVPLICAGGVGTEADFVRALDLGYAGVQMGTRFIATDECRAAEPYKQAILDADEDDIVLTERITGVPVSVIRTPYIERLGTRAGAFARWMLRGRRRKHWMRNLYALKSLWLLKRASLDETGSRDYWQAGRSVQGIHAVEPAGEVVRRFAAALARRWGAEPAGFSQAEPTSIPGGHTVTTASTDRAPDPP